MRTPLSTKAQNHTITTILLKLFVPGFAGPEFNLIGLFENAVVNRNTAK
jgi:hypothetical protein